MRALVFLAAVILTAPHSAPAQWQLQSAPTTADLRGIDNVGNGIAWASGSGGTILRTTDNGAHWQRCTTPTGADHLDFRGIQAFDANTAIAMSSGPGDQSRLYKTTDGCQNWKLVFTNPDKDGFWDDIAFAPRSWRQTTSATTPSQHHGTLYILGDPVRGHFVVWTLAEPLKRKGKPKRLKGLPRAKQGDTIFAASNSSLLLGRHSPFFAFGIGSNQGAHWLREVETVDNPGPWWTSSMVPVGTEDASSGVFSVAFRYSPQSLFKSSFEGIFGTPESTPDMIGVAVGGDYRKPNDTAWNAAYTHNGGQLWIQPNPTTQPHGYRSAVAYDAPTKTWITVGPNGTDISTDDGRNWRAIKPSPGQAPDADQHWNALSLPFVVGPHGRIGILSPATLRP